MLVFLSLDCYRDEDPWFLGLFNVRWRTGVD